MKDRNFFTRQDLQDLTGLDSLPGQAPYTRGVRDSTYGDRPWTIRQYGGFGSAEQTNALFKKQLSKGQTGLSVAFDLPTQRGYDSDHPTAGVEVGRTGVAIDSVEDMHALFDGIALNRVSVSLTINGSALPVLAALLVVAEENGIAQSKLRGTVQNDILKEFIARNCYIFQPEFSARISADILEYSVAHLPYFNALSISGYHFHEAGADCALELALTIANGLEYVKLGVDRGLSIDTIGPRLSFFFGVGMQFYQEIAKLRAARQIWSESLSRYRPTNPESSKLRMHCQTAGSSLTWQQPQNNIVRTTIEAMAAIFGGTQSLHTNAFDEALCLPGENARRTALNTQLILREESDIPSVADPWGGSYFMETLTQQLISKTRELMDTLIGNDGMFEAVTSGRPQRLLAEAAVRKQLAIETGRRPIVGVNCFESEEDPIIRSHDKEQGRLQFERRTRLQALRERRNSAAVKNCLNAITASASSGKGNLLSLTIEAMRERATVGEVTAAMQIAQPRFEQAPILLKDVCGPVCVNDPQWQRARRQASLLKRRLEKTPRVLVATLGQDGHDRAAILVAALFNDLGLNTELAPLFQSPAMLAERVNSGEHDILAISSHSDAHMILGRQLLLRLRGRHHLPLMVIGGVIDAQDQKALLEDGFDAVFNPRLGALEACADTLELAVNRATEPKHRSA